MESIISRSSRLVVVPVVLSASLLALAACGTPAPPEPGATPIPTPQPATDAIRVVVLGNSLAAGMGLAEADAFPAVTEALLRDAGHSVAVLNAGVSGDTTAGALARIDWVLTQRPEILVVELGANDALRGQPLSSTESNLREIIRRGRSAGARVLLLGMDVPTNYGPEYGAAFAEIYQRIARDEAATLIPGFVREVGSDPALLQPDGLHPTGEGQRRLAETLLPGLGAMIEEIERERAPAAPPARSP